MIPVGIDPSTKRLAMVAGEPGGRYHADLATLNTGKDIYGPDVAGRAYEATYRFLKSLDGPEVYLEAPAALKVGIQSTLLQGYVSGAIQAAAANLEVRLHLIAPAHWKAQVIGHGNATKDGVRAWITTAWPEAAVQSQDLIDAAALAVYGGTRERRTARLG